MPSNRQTSWILVGLATFAAVFFAVQPKAPSQPDKTGDQSQAEREKKPPDHPGGPLKPVWEAFPSAEPGKEPAADPKCWPEAKPWKKYDASIRFLIATVPDPVESGFGYLFDQVVEAMQRALETQGYVIDRAWLPWPRAGTKAPKDQPHKRQPGLILFRLERSSGEGGALKNGHGRARRYLALLLVGETATAGIHMAAFKESLELIKKCPPEAKEEEPCGFPIRVLGPYFSGSRDSLALALQQARPGWGGDPLTTADVITNSGGYPWGAAPLVGRILAAAGQLPPIHVVCGSATSLDPDEFTAPWKRLADKFRSTVIPDFLVRRWVYKFLQNPADPTTGTQPDTLVVLQEADTGFGQLSDAQFKRTRPGVKPDSGRSKRIFTIRFPVHISQLRTSFTKAQLAQLESLGLPRPAWNIPVPPGEEGGKTADPVPPQSPLLTTALTSLVVNNLVQTMAKERIRYVTLIASDARDVVFLAELIRNRFPDVQLCTTGGELLYTDPDHRYALGGMVVGSTYPLQPRVQGWGGAVQGPERRRLLFAEQSSQGSYNATLVHLGKHAEEAMLDYGVGCEKRPGIWISAVGQNGQMIPLYYVTAKEIDTDLKHLEEQVKEPKDRDWIRNLRANGEHLYLRTPPPQAGELPRGAAPPILWELLFVALTVTVCALGYKYGCYWIRHSRWGAEFSEGLAASKHRIDFTIAGLAVIAFYSWIAKLSAIPCRYPAANADSWARAADGLVTGAAVAMIVVTELCILWVYWRRDDDPTFWGEAQLSKYRRLLTDCTPLKGRIGEWLPRVSAWLVAMEVLVLGASLVLCYCGLKGVGDALFASTPGQTQTLIDFERVVSLTNGLSPLVPIFFLCAAFFAWGLFLVKKLHFANRHSVPCPFPENGPAGFQQLRQTHDEVLHELMPPSTWQHHPGLCLLVFFLLVGVYVKLWHESIPPIDGRLFGNWTLAAFFAGSFLLVFTLCQVYLAWSKLRHMLRQLALMPMVGAFARLPEKVKSEDGHLFSLRPKDERLTVVTHLFNALCRRFAAFRKWLESVSGQPSGPCPVPLDQTANAFREQFSETSQGDPVPLPGNFDKTPPAPGSPGGAPAASAAQDPEERLSETAQKCLLVLHNLWPIHSMDEAFGGAPQEEKSGAAAPPQEKPGTAAPFLSPPEGDPVREWVHWAEDFVAAWVVRYLSQFFAQLRNLLTSLTVGSLLLILAAVSYPFRLQSLLLVVLTALTGAVAVFIVVFLVQVNRNELISRIKRSTPNRFTPDLGFFQGATAYVLPIVGGLMVWFPFFASGLRSLFEPLLHVIR
jgi:hypothetical protein